MEGPMSNIVGVYRLPTEVDISSAALERAADFSKAYTTCDTIVVFSWTDSSSVQYKSQKKWKDLGSGVDIGTNNRVSIPKEKIWSSGKMNFAVMLPDDVLNKSLTRQIDVTDREGYLFDLR